MIKDIIEREGKTYSRHPGKKHDCTGCVAKGNRYQCYKLLEAGQECFYSVPGKDEPDYKRPSIWILEELTKC
jgi:hypothetical protein